METVFEKLIDPLFLLFDGSQRIFWLYLYGALVIGIITFFHQKRKKTNTRKKGLFSYLFPKVIYTHKSAVNDYGFFYLNTVLKALIFVPLFGYVVPVVRNTTDGILGHIFPSLYGILPGDNILLALIFTIATALTIDFSVYLAHYWQHKNPWLWEFHKVHHSAEVLTPITVYRMHPIDDMLTVSLVSIMSGFVFGFFYFITGGEVSLIFFFGLNVFFFLFYLLGYNLRHSHIWVDYGSFWSRVFISPAQHQIHHSAEERHYDKNMGLIFAFWDGLFRTLYVPKEREEFTLGLANSEHREFNRGLVTLYLRPFVQVAKKIKARRTSYSIPAVQFALFFVIIIPAIVISQSYSTELPPVKSHVYLEDMTWTEVRNEVAAGKTIVLVPTGGTEQNGPHVVLGKHNKIIHYTAGKIAERLGNALVAPVISYVPEGQINPADGHMKFSGTISVPEPVFRSVLENTARSLKQHGFKTICFVGDSGGNQESQRQVADRLKEEWRNEGIRVIHVSDYYARNGQVGALKNKGISIEAIGGHAGIRDTSELMAVYPQGVRIERLADNQQANFEEVGANGNSHMANSALGKELLEQKINAAIRQIQKELF